MPWIDDKFYYTTKLLKVIAESYTNFYDGLLFRGNLVTHPLALAEYRADFDIALQSVGKGKWIGLDSHRFKDYHYFGRLQRIVIADILGIKDYELEGKGFYSVPRLRGYAYYLMAKYLNG